MEELPKLASNTVMEGTTSYANQMWRKDGGGRMEFQFASLYVKLVSLFELIFEVCVARENLEKEMRCKVLVDCFEAEIAAIIREDRLKIFTRTGPSFERRRANICS